MIIKKVKKYKFEYIIVFSAILISIIWGTYNLKKFDKIKINFKENYFNRLLYTDLSATWLIADKFKKNLDQGNSFLESIPEYGRFLLPSIIVGYYYHLIDKEIYKKMENEQIVIKEKNFKFGLLIFQIIIYYLSLIFFSKELKKIINSNLHKCIIIFLALEPSLLQWHSSFYSESIFLSLMLILFTLILKKSDKIFVNLSIGIILGLMFMQRAVSFLYILPIIFYLFFIHKKKIKIYFLFIVGYLMIVLFVGYNNYKKTDHFYFLSLAHQYHSYYHYFAADILADRNKISPKDAKNILFEEEKKWINENNINIDSTKDLSKNIKYRNKIFLREVINNPIYVLKKMIKKTLTMCIIHPFWVNQHFGFDKTDPKAKENPKEYYNKNLFNKIPYSIFIYIFALIGILKLINKIIARNKLDEFDKFLVFNIFSIFYFIIISGMWGNPKYFAPCMVSISYFFSMGFLEIKKKYF